MLLKMLLNTLKVDYNELRLIEMRKMAQKYNFSCIIANSLSNTPYSNVSLSCHRDIEC